MWKNLYDSFLQSMTMSWARYMAQNASSGREVRNNFQNRVYADAGLWLLILSIAFSVIYYYYLNRRFGRYYSRASWFALLFISSLAVWLATWLRTRAILQGSSIDVSRQVFCMGLINACYGAILFFLLSLVLKWASPMGKKTPF